jgi:hypothetical protein
VDEPADPVNDGAGIVNLAWAGTGAFAVTAIVATILDRDAFTYVAVGVALALFAVGCGAFLWAYALAVARSREELIGIGGLYFLAGTAPKVVAFRLRLVLAIEVVIALATSAIRPYTSVAFGILVPMFGLGLMGLWGARHGTFAPREQ